MKHREIDEPNRWRGFVLGLLAGAAGTAAMGGYWGAATRWSGGDPRAATREGGPHQLDGISLVGIHHQPEESSTAAMGRIAYERIAGRAPEAAETKTTLSYLIHYGYGSLQGGLLGALTAGGRGAVVPTGAVYGTGMWLLGDEAAISLLGLADGPGRYPLSQHLHRGAAHLAYGVATAMVAAVLGRLLPDSGAVRR